MAVERERPHGQFNFEVELGDLRAGFHGCSSESREVRLAEYRIGDVNASSVQSTTGIKESAYVTLEHGVMGKLALYRLLDDMRKANRPAFENVIIHMTSEDHQQVVLTWKLHRARILKHVSGPLDAKGTDVTVDELTLAYERLEWSSRAAGPTTSRHPVRGTSLAPALAVARMDVAGPEAVPTLTWR